MGSEGERMSCCKYHGNLVCEKMHECDGCKIQAEWKENEKREFEEMMRKTSRNIDVGYLSALFDTTIESISKIAVDERISNVIHKTINPMLDNMIDELYSMKNNTLATMMFANDEKTKIVQSTRADIIRSLYCDKKPADCKKERNE